MSLSAPPSRSAEWLSTAVALGFGVLAAALVTLGASRALFSASVENSGSNISAAAIELTSDAGATAMFDAQGLEPGQSVVQCIVVTYSGTVSNPSTVRLYSGGYDDDGGLDEYLNLDILVGDGGEFDDCDEFDEGEASAIGAGDTLADFASSHNEFSNGAGQVGDGQWTPGAEDLSRTYQFTIELDSEVSNDVQGAELEDLTFVWEVQG